MSMDVSTMLPFMLIAACFMSILNYRKQLLVLYTI